VRETPFVKPGDDVPNIGSSQQFEDVVAPLNNQNDVGDRTGIKDGFAIPMLVDKRDPRTQEFNEVKDKVTQAVKQEQAKTQLEAKAKELIANAKTPGELKAAAAKYGFEAKAEAKYKVGSPLADLGSSYLIDDPLFAAQAGQVLGSPIFLNENYIVIGVTKRTEADLAEFTKQRDSLIETAQTERKDQVFNDYLGAVLARMKRDGDLEIYKEVLDQLREPEIDVPGRPQLPVTQ